jgi:hypothetical protein
MEEMKTQTKLKGLELLEKHTLTAKIIRDWFLKKMMESFKDETVPEEFKQYMIDQGVENEKVATLIDVNPRMLLDVFDENEIYIHIEPFCNELEKQLQSFGYRILFNDYMPKNMEFKNRKEAELFAIEAAFEILEKQLTPKENTDENE